MIDRPTDRRNNAEQKRSTQRLFFWFFNAFPLDSAVGSFIVFSGCNVVGVLGRYALKILVILLTFIAFCSCSLDPPPKGEGSFEEEDVIKRTLATLDANRQEALPSGYYQMRLGNGEPYIITATDSHSPRGGGTIGVLFRDGTIFTHFGHVCGPGPTPLAGFAGGSQDDLIHSIRQASSPH